MSNSFYYFFSATPQVLGGVLALFGVFVIFKIQTIKTGLLSIGEVINEFLWRLLPQPGRKTDSDEIKNRRNLHHEILKCLQSQNIKELNAILTKVKDERLLEEDKFKLNSESYRSQYQFLHSLITDIIRSSVITSIIIVSSLMILPLGHLLCDYKVLTYILFFIFLVGIIISFSNLIKVLIRSLQDA